MEKILVELDNDILGFSPAMLERKKKIKERTFRKKTNGEKKEVNNIFNLIKLQTFIYVYIYRIKLSIPHF